MFERPIRNCSAPWEWLVVGPDGLAQPCCFTFEQVGDLKEHSVAEIWNGPRMVRLRKAIASGHVDPICRRGTCGYVVSTLERFGEKSYDYSCSVGQSYTVNAEGELRHLASGWHTAEKWGVWSDGIEATLRLHFSDMTDFPHEVHVMCRGYANEAIEQQIIQVEAQNEKVAEWTFRYPHETHSETWRSFPLTPLQMLSGQVVITFRASKAISPKNVGMDDARNLGLGIAGFKVEECAGRDDLARMRAIIAAESRTMIAREWQDITHKCIDLAKSGNVEAIRICMEALYHTDDK